MSKRLIPGVILLLAILFPLSHMVSAQVRTTGQLSGTVLDPSGAAIAGATITVSQSVTGFSQSATANESGEYVFPALQPGTYQLRASAKGFSDAAYDNLVVGAGRTTDLRVQLKVGESTETVRVSTEGEVLETTSNTLSSTISPEGIQNLPLGGRDVLPFAQLVPGAQSGGDQRFTTYNALPNAAINITVDGVNNNFQRYRTSTTGFYTAAPLRLGAFDEVTVSTDSLTADAGAEGSVQLRFVTKRGTNDFHGSAFWQAQNSVFNANSFNNNALGAPKSSSHLNDYGGSLGGPIWKNKIFFFFNYEEEDSPFAVFTGVQIPTQPAQQGTFTYTGLSGAQHTVNLLSVAQANGFPSTADPIMAGIFSQLNGFSSGQTLSPLNGLAYMNQLNFFQKQSNTNRYPTARVDYQITPKIAFHASWDLYWRKIANTEPYPGDKHVNNGFKSTYYTGMLGFDWTLTPRLVNQFNFGVLSTVEEFNPGNNFTEFADQGNVQVIAPNLANGQGAIFNPVVPSFIFPLPRNNPLWNIYDNVSWTRGKHTFTFGGDIRISTMRELESDPPPLYNLGLNSLDPGLSMFNTTNFPDINTASDLLNAEALYATIVGRLNNVSGANYVDGKTRQYKVAGALNYLEKQTVGGIYFQDAYRVTPHLALNYGFRWQFSGAIHNTNNFATNPTYADLLGPSTGEFQPGQLGGGLNPQIALRPAPYTADYRQPAPNFGFAWNPTWDNGVFGRLAGGGNLVIRGGVRVSHFDEGWTTFEQATIFGNPGAQQTAFLNPGFAAGQFAPGSLSLSSNITPQTVPTSFNPPFPQSLFTFSNQTFATVDPKIRAPYVESWNFGVQRKLPGNTVLELAYVGNHSVHLWQNFDLNEVNIFENGFLNEFKNAQTDLAINGGTTFADNTGAPGLIPLPIFEAAFGGTGSALPNAPLLGSSFSNSQFIPLLQQGQTGALANALASSASYLCNLVGGTTFSPCAGYGGGKYPLNFFQVNPFAAGSSAILLSNPGSSAYNGLQLQVKHPVGRGLMLMANYTYSHAFTTRYIGDYFTADQAVANFTTLRNPGLNRVPSPYDLRHVFRTYATYDLPFGTRRPFKTRSSIVNHVIGDWTVGTVVTAQSGRNFKLLGGFNSFNYFNNPLNAPDESDSGVILNGITKSQLQSNVGVFNGPNGSEPVVFLNPKLFANGAQPILPVSTPGQLGSFIFLTGPMFVNTDISIIKSIPIWERVRLNIFTEMINAFNHPNWAVTDNFSTSTNNPAQYVNIQSTTSFGASIANPNNANGVHGARSIQFRLQLTF
jgi:hypothetical protein